MPSEFREQLRRHRRLMRQRERERDLERMEKEDLSDLAPGEEGDGRIVRKRIEDEGMESLWEQ